VLKNVKAGRAANGARKNYGKSAERNVIQIDPPDAGEYGDVHVISLKLLRGSDCCPLAIM